MRTHHALLAALLVGVAAGPADARTYCLLAKENPGDHDPVYHAATRGPTPFGPYDIKSMDVATNATHLTGVLRIGDLSDVGPAAEHDGAVYTMWFSLDPERNYFFEITRGGGRDEFVLWQEDQGWIAPEDERAGIYSDPTKPVLVTRAVRGVTDLRADELRMTVPLSVFGRKVMVPGRKLSKFGANSASTKVQLDDSQEPGWRYVFSQHEDAISARRTHSYPIGAPSCVRVGR